MTTMGFNNSFNNGKTKLTTITFSREEGIDSAKCIKIRKLQLHQGYRGLHFPPLDNSLPRMI
ncbi:hypothetical protein AMR44_07065 [Shewanella algae]|nr:hypothetical protein AMR44_07065 [Shewanella algae]